MNRNLKVKRERRKIKVFIVGFMLFLLLIMPFSYAASISSDSSIYGYSPASSNAQFYKPTFGTYSQRYAYDYWPALKESDKCEATSDFLMFIRPGGCDPMIVRSDLLEEQNVPVFCKVDVVKINPLVDITRLKSVKFTGSSSYIAGISFHPNQEAINAHKGYLDEPLINDAGYVVVLLKKIPREEDMPESVRVNLTGVLRYDVEGYFGAAEKKYYLNVMNDLNWTKNYPESSFWKGKGYLRAEYVEGNEAGISVYQDKESRLVRFDLKKGETSGMFYMPGFYCKAGLQVRLDDVVAPVKKAQLEIDGDKQWVVEGEKFLDDKCQVMRIDIPEVKEETVGKEREITVKIKCKEKSAQDLQYVEELKKVDGEEKWVLETSEEIKDNNNIDGEVKNKFEKAEEIVVGEGGLATLYGAESYRGDGEFKTIWPARALFELAGLADKIGLKNQARDYYSKVIDEYPDSDYAQQAVEKIRLLYSDIEGMSYEEHYIRLISARFPPKGEASADFSVWKLDDKGEETGKPSDKIEGKQITQQFADGFKLIEITSDKVKLEYKGETFEIGEKETKWVPDAENNKEKKQVKEYKIKLEKIHLEEVAKITLISKMPNEYSEADFVFEIGIEKRAIQLTPEKAAEKIANLNKSIEKWEGILENLGNVVKTMKAACYTTAIFLFVKNFIQNLGGGATARQKVNEIYFAECQKTAGTSEAEFTNCLKDKEKEMNKDMDIYKKNVEDVNKIFEGQENYKDNSGNVDRTGFAKKLIKDYDLTEFKKDGEVIDSPDLEDVREVLFNKRIIIADTTASQLARDNAEAKIAAIKIKLEPVTGTAGTTNTKAIIDLYSGDITNFIDKNQVVYYNTGSGKGVVRVVPIPQSYENKKGEKVSGFYAYVPEDGYEASGNFKRFYIANVGEKGYADITSDNQILITNYQFGQRSDYFKDYNPFNLGGANGEEMYNLVRNAEEAIVTANDNYGKKEFKLFNTKLNVNIKETIWGGGRCVDFMSASDCTLLFNLCDPVLCPSSRCDLGGKYRVDNVIQSGIIGSIALCLPNAKWAGGDVYIPVCLSGVHAGLDSYLSIMKAYRDCLQEKIDTGQYVGLCDEIYSVYLCEFFWKQMAPLSEALVTNLIGGIQGEGMKGGGEYLTVQDAWTNMEKSVDWMKNDYAINAVNAFQARSTGEIGTEFCKVFVSARYPANKKFFDNLLAPDSPVQFQAWFDEIPQTTATVPATSHYKVYYHIYAGKDEGANYQVYLRNPPASAYVNVQQMFIVKTGFIPRGEYVDEAKDLTAPSGYQELCVRINGKDECGFGKVSTSYALNSLSDKYYEEQASEKDINSEKECISGTSSAYSLLQPNIQAGVEEVINPDLEKKGVVRICSTLNPDSADKERWKEVGNCGNKELKCWLDMKSVEAVIKGGNIESEVGITEAVEAEYLGTEKVNDILREASRKIDEIKKSIDGAADKNEIKRIEYGTELAELFAQLDEVSDIKTNIDNRYKAEALYYKFRVYYLITDGLFLVAEEKNGGIRDISKVIKEEPKEEGIILVDANGKYWKRLKGEDGGYIWGEVDRYGVNVVDGSLNKFVSLNEPKLFKEPEEEKTIMLSLSANYNPTDKINILLNGEYTGLYLKGNKLYIQSILRDREIGTVVNNKIILISNQKGEIDKLDPQLYSFLNNAEISGKEILISDDEKK